jgi:hypothetical protein
MPRPKSNPEGGATTSNGKDPRNNKMLAMKLALKANGRKAKPKKLQEWLHKEYGLEMTTNLISNYKSHILKRRGKPGRPPKSAAEKAASAAAATAASAEPVRRHAISVTDVQTVKDLAQRIGADQVKQLAEMWKK